MKKPLTYDIKRRIYMSYGPRHRCPKGRATQWGSHPAAQTCPTARGRRTPCPGWSISKRQAYRYLEQAQQLKHPIPIEEAKVSFTVKLSRRLVERLRRYGASTGLTLSEIVSRALLAVLHRGGGRG